MHPRELDTLSRGELIEKAESLGVDKANLLTRAELADEIVRRTVVDPIERRIARGLLGIARDLVARVVERGLHLPDAAARIRGTGRPSWVPARPPIATVTLAEIYAAQGHRNRALSVLDEVLEREADHAAARTLRDEIAASPADEPVAARESQLPASWVAAASLSGDPASPDAPGSDTVIANDATSIAGGPKAAPSNTSGAALPGDAADANAVGQVGMLDDAPLPGRYDVDEVVLMPVDPKTVFVYWEVRQQTLDEAKSRAEDGMLIVRIVAVTASWEGAVVETRDIEVGDLVGDWFVRDLPVGSVLRAAVGWRAKTGFEPLSVAMETTAPPAGAAFVGAGELARFTAEGIVPLEVPADDPLALAIERARRRIARESAAASGAGSSSSWPSMPPSPWSGSEDLPHSGARL